MLCRGRGARRQTALEGQIASRRRAIRATVDQRPGGHGAGKPRHVAVVGSHLDSVAEGPGINDNGSGSAAILEPAMQLAALGICPANRVRFAWWGAEESGPDRLDPLLEASPTRRSSRWRQISTSTCSPRRTPSSSSTTATSRTRRRRPPRRTFTPSAAYVEQTMVGCRGLVRGRHGADGVRRPQRLQALPGQRRRRRRPVLRGRGRQVRRAGRQVGRHGWAWRSTRATTRRATPSTTSTFGATRTWPTVARTLTATLAEDPALRDTLAGGPATATATKAKKAKKLSKAPSRPSSASSAGGRSSPLTKTETDAGSGGRPHGRPSCVLR